MNAADMPKNTEFAALLAAATSIAKTITASRPAFLQFYDNVLAGLRRPELPASFMQAIVIASRQLEQYGLPALDPRQNRAAFILALFALGKIDPIANLAMGAIAEGLSDPVGGGLSPEKRNRTRANAAAVVRKVLGVEGKGMMPAPRPDFLRRREAAMGNAGSHHRSQSELDQSPIALSRCPSRHPSAVPHRDQGQQ